MSKKQCSNQKMVAPEPLGLNLGHRLGGKCLHLLSHPFGSEMINFEQALCVLTLHWTLQNV